MTNHVAKHLPEWLNPLADEATVVPQPIVSRQQIEIASRRVLSEPLTAQRIVTVSRLGLTLADDGETSGLSLSGWGHSLPSTVAVLMPLSASITESPGISDRAAYAPYEPSYDAPGGLLSTSYSACPTIRCQMACCRIPEGSGAKAGSYFIDGSPLIAVSFALRPTLAALPLARPDSMHMRLPTIRGA